MKLKKKVVTGIMMMLLLVSVFCIILNVKLVTAWSNGGYSSDPDNPNYGTHDWIAQHALDWLPTQEKQYIQDNLVAYLYGTELPDNPAGIGDTMKHHVYYGSNGSLQDDVSAVRAYEEHNNTLDFLRLGDLVNASKTAGIMSHYIVDVAVFGHVMGAGTDWGAEQHHSDYESYVNQRTDSYWDEFNAYLSFDGELSFTSAYDAAKELAYDTTFDVDGNLTCVWMDGNYDWSNPVFKDRCGESLNLAVNYLTDVLHTLYQASARSTTYPWSMFRHNPRHTGYTESPAPRTNQTLWNYTTDRWVHSSPAVADGKVYVGSIDNKVYALDATTGAYIWNYTTGHWVRSSPAVADGKVYVSSFDDKVYCLNATTGAYIWNYTTGSDLFSSPTVADGKVYVGSYDNKVYALDASTGSPVWNYTTGSQVLSSPAVADGVVYVGSYDNKVYALDASSGALIWSYMTGGGVRSSPAVADGKVYIGSDDYKVYALDASTGSPVWNYTTGDYVYSSPAVADGKVYVGSADCKVYALDASTGSPVWNYTTGGIVDSSPAVADGKVYVGSWDNNIYALKATTGARIWSYTTGDYVRSSPAVADGVVYVGSYDNRVYAFGNVIRVPEDYPTVQEAIDAATAACIPGATISIAAGTYHEYLTINKTLTLLGRPGSSPKFDGDASGIAVTITNTYEVIVTNINITNYEKAILIDNSSDCKIYNNIMSSMVYSGITSKGDNAVNNRIYNNIFENDNNIAIDLTESSTSNTIYGNTISSNNIGLNLLESNGNTIYANTISQNEIGIDISSSSYNTIYHNNFIDNTQQATTSNPSSNTWDAGYPIGGNYWSNYDGTDANGDGIGDTPYEIDENNRDRYPLMEPWPCEITPRAPVGGIYIPVNKLELLAPYIGLTILLAVAVVTVGYVKKRKRDAKINS